MRAEAMLYVSIAYWDFCPECKLTHLFILAKTGAGHAQPGTFGTCNKLLCTSTDEIQFKENPDSWLLVDQILEKAQYPQTKCE
jgi:hypothetical protein